MSSFINLLRNLYFLGLKCLAGLDRWHLKLGSFFQNYSKLKLGQYDSILQMKHFLTVLLFIYYKILKIIKKVLCKCSKFKGPCWRQSASSVSQSFSGPRQSYSRLRSLSPSTATFRGS
jgi:hypothetical protein